MVAPIEFRVTGMTCSHCERAVADEVGRLANVASVDVNVTTGRLIITSTAPVPDAQILAAVDGAGYAASRSI